MKKLVNLVLAVLAFIGIVLIMDRVLFEHAPKTVPTIQIRIKNPIVEPKQAPQEEEGSEPTKVALKKGTPQKGVLVQGAIHMVFEDEKEGGKGQN